MIGRAGRPQFDDSGVACIFVHEPKKNFYRKFLHEPFPVESSLHEYLHNHINAEIATGTIANKRDCLDYLSWTYLFRRLVMNPSYYQVESAETSAVQNRLTSLIDSVVSDLNESGCIFVSEDFELSPTMLGHAASYYYLDYRTVSMFSKELRCLQDDVDVRHLMRLLCDATEFNELPVRHNEDKLNAELASRLPWAMSPDENMESSNVKAYILLQAYIYDIPLPISDYVNDTKSVLDQVARVLSAMVDVAADSGRLTIVLQLSRLSQLISQV